MTYFAGIYHTNQTPVPGNLGYQLMKSVENNQLEQALLWQRNHLVLGWLATSNSGWETCYDEERKLAIVADIDFYQREELLHQLNEDGEINKNVTDVELLLQAYQKWGTTFPNYLDADFAFIIWDEQKEELFGARDMNGKKTLYFHYVMERFSFCNRLTPLLSLPYIEKRLHDQWFRVNLDPNVEIGDSDAMLTPYKDMMQLPPGCALFIQNQQLKTDHYCKRRSIFRI